MLPWKLSYIWELIPSRTFRFCNILEPHNPALTLWRRCSFKKTFLIKEFYQFILCLFPGGCMVHVVRAHHYFRLYYLLWLCTVVSRKLCTRLFLQNHWNNLLKICTKYTFKQIQVLLLGFLRLLFWGFFERGRVGFSNEVSGYFK